MKKSVFCSVSVIALLVTFLLMSLFACTRSTQKLKLKEEYKAVFLDNGQVYFGRIEEEGPVFILLTDVFYIQSQIVQKDKDTREVKNILIKRGNECHGPDRMYVNLSHIVLIEPVSPESRVAQLIKEAKAVK